jgi:multiple antibiotic resistance protein
VEHLDWKDFITNFVTLWVVLDPISAVPIFLALTPGMEPARRRMVATKAVLVSLGVLLFFIVAGQFLLEALEIPLYSFQIAGGIILFIFALNLIFGHSKSQSAETTAPSESDTSIAVHPLAIPAIAGPGAMLAVVLLTDKDRYSFGQQVDTVGMLVVILLILWLVLMLANPISRVIGASGASVLARIMGLLLAAVAADNVLRAAKIYVNTVSVAVGG